jgi:hypothetical protein
VPEVAAPYSIKDRQGAEPQSSLWPCPSTMVGQITVTGSDAKPGFQATPWFWLGGCCSRKNIMLVRGAPARKNAKTSGASPQNQTETRPIALEPLQIRVALPSMTVNDRVDRCRPVTGRHIVPQERKLEAAAAE